MKHFLNFCVLLLVVSCTAAQISEDGFYGDSFNADTHIGLDELTQNLATQEKVEAVVKGKVESVCQKKGCWMNIVNDEGQSIFVKFKDYGFFMPLDLAGKEVVMDGYAFKEVTSVEELQHYAEDEGLSQEEISKIKTAKEEYKFMASGVFIEQ